MTSIVNSTVLQARESLGNRLREIRKEARLTGKQVAELAQWHPSKVTRLEQGNQAPSDKDLAVWCDLCEAPEQLSDLIAAARDIESMYVEWRRRLRTGTRRRQEKSQMLESAATLLRSYEPMLVPGLLQTREYATTIMAGVIAFYGIPDDLSAGVDARLDRQRLLTKNRQRGRYEFIISEQVLYNPIGDEGVMGAQLDRLLEAQQLPKVRLGIVPQHHAQFIPAMTGFLIFDSELVQIETISAELSVKQPREIELYLKAFNQLSERAAFDAKATALIWRAKARMSPPQRAESDVPAIPVISGAAAANVAHVRPKSTAVRSRR